MFHFSAITESRPKATTDDINRRIGKSREPWECERQEGKKARSQGTRKQENKAKGVAEGDAEGDTVR